MQAYKVGEYFTLIFTKVLDELTRGPVDQDEEAEDIWTDRKYWEEERATKETLQLTDELFAIVREFDPALELKYNKFYIGLARKGRADNFVTFTPRKRIAGIEPRIPRTDELDTQIKSSG